MKTAVRIIAQHYDVNTKEVIETWLVREDAVEKPKTLNELGYLHEEQIEILKSLQDFKIKHESVLLNQDNTCPKCQLKVSSHGSRISNFHAALTDHKVKIKRTICQCGWRSSSTIESIYGSSLHPDLLEKQAVQGAENSYRHASRNLNAESQSTRPINNDDRIRRSVAKVAEVVGAQKLNEPDTVGKITAAKKLIAVVDGGHVKANQYDARSFEAMISTVYRPENIQVIDKNHNEITQKTSVASALSDKQKTIKKLVQNACRIEGAHAEVTELTCLTDGAKNCWSITKSLEPLCKILFNILDWFHITKRFTIIDNVIGEEFKDRLKKVKWHLWHGNSQTALDRLKSLISETVIEKIETQLIDLQDYVKRNEKYLVNYESRKSAGLPFTSTVAESSVNSLINTRQKRNQKMQWSRTGSHNILQIRTSIFSKTWNKDWLEAQQEIYQNAA